MTLRRDDKPQEGIYALVSGAGSLVTKDGLRAVILVEEVKDKSETPFKSTIYGTDPVIVLLFDKKRDKWHITGPADQLKKQELLRLAKGLMILAESRPDPPDKSKI